MSSSSPASTTSSSIGKWVGLATAALAGITIVKTLMNLDDPTQASNKKRNSSCCSSSATSSSGYVTVGSNPASNPYETQQSVHEYLLMHFGTAKELMNFPTIQSQQLQASMNFPRECAEFCGRYLATNPALTAQNSTSVTNSGLRALDVGCSVGRSSFELTRFVQTVVGLDYSQAFIDTANQLKSLGELPYTIRTEGDLVQSAIARVSPELDRSRVQFIQGDACDLHASLHGQQFHVVLAANLLCRLPFPRRFLSALPSVVVAGGFVVMPSPYTWLEQYTPKSEWIGGYVNSSTGAEVKSFDGLKGELLRDGYFTLVDQFDTPFFIRETARKNQLSYSHVTVWQRTNKPTQ